MFPFVTRTCTHTLDKENLYVYFCTCVYFSRCALSRLVHLLVVCTCNWVCCNCRQNSYCTERNYSCSLEGLSDHARKRNTGKLTLHELAKSRNATSWDACTCGYIFCPLCLLYCSEYIWKLKICCFCFLEVFCPRVLFREEREWESRPKKIPRKNKAAGQCRGHIARFQHAERQFLLNEVFELHETVRNHIFKKTLLAKKKLFSTSVLQQIAFSFFCLMCTKICLMHGGGEDNIFHGHKIKEAIVFPR